VRGISQSERHEERPGVDLACIRYMHEVEVHYLPAMRMSHTTVKIWSAWTIGGDDWKPIV